MKFNLRTPQTSASFAGKVSPGKTPWEAKGAVILQSPSSAAIAGLAGPQLASFIPEGPFRLTASLDKTGTLYTIGKLDVSAGETAASGTVKLDAAGETPGVEAELETAEASLPKLAVFLTGGPPRDIMGQAQSALTSTWFERPFAAAVFTGPAQSLRLKARTLDTGTGLVLQDARLEASLRDGALAVTALTGRVLDGKFTADGLLKKFTRIPACLPHALTDASLAQFAPQGGRPPHPAR
jgi:hypothetical protein